jgi:outer membrane protein
LIGSREYRLSLEGIEMTLRHSEQVMNLNLGLYKRITAILAVCFAFVSPVSAQSVSLAEAARLMAVNETQYRILDLEGAVAQELVRQALGERLPRVRLSVNYVQTQQDIISQDNKTFQLGQSSYPTTTISIALTQPLYDAPRFRALPLAKAEAELVGLQAEAARSELASLLVRSYLGVARAELRQAQARVVLRARTQLNRDMTEMVAAGRMDQGRQLQAQGDVFAAQADLAEADLDLAEALFELRRFTGTDVTGVAADGDFGVSEANALRATFSTQRLADMNPAVQVARAESAVAERRLAQVRGAFHPTANLSAQFEREDTQGSLFGGGSVVESLDVGVELGWTLYEGGVRRSQVREFGGRLEIAQLREGQALDMAQRRYDALISALGSSLQVVAATGRDRAAAARRVSDARAEVAAGRVTSDRVLDAELRRDVAALQARSARLRAVEIQSQIMALFGALDIETLSSEFSGA